MKRTLRSALFLVAAAVVVVVVVLLGGCSTLEGIGRDIVWVASLRPER